MKLHAAGLTGAVLGSALVVVSACTPTQDCTYAANGQCFTLQSEVQTSLAAAEAVCQAIGGHVAYASDEATFTALNELATEYASTDANSDDTWWLGLAASSGCDFQPLDASTAIGFTSWNRYVCRCVLDVRACACGWICACAFCIRVCLLRACACLRACKCVSVRVDMLWVVTPPPTRHFDCHSTGQRRAERLQQLRERVLRRPEWRRVLRASSHRRCVASSFHGKQPRKR
jgi:hypothetical protein